MENTTTHEDLYEDDTPQSLLIRNREGGWNRKEMLYLIGAGILILIILAIALWPEGETTLPPIGSATTSSEIPGTAGGRLDALDQRLTEIEHRLNQAPGLTGQNEGTGAEIAVRARENSERIEQVLARLETIDRRLSEIQKTAEDRPETRAAAQPRTETPSQSAGQQFYEVKKGDTPYSIARRQKMALKALLDLNGMNSRAVIHPGDRIRVK